jgi:ribosomal protein L17
MRHRRKATKLGRNPSHRKAMRKNMALALFEHERIVTTKEKAKFVRSFVEKLITLAKVKTDHNQRLVFSRLQGAQRLNNPVPGRQKEKAERWDRRMVKKLTAPAGIHGSSSCRPTGWVMARAR